MSQLVSQNRGQSNEETCHYTPSGMFRSHYTHQLYLGKKAKSVTIEFAWFHFRALNISNSLSVFVADLFTLDPFQASGLTQVISTLQADALSMFALQHDAQRPHGQTNEAFLKLKPLFRVYTLAEPSTLRSCKEVSPPLFPFLSLTPCRFNPDGPAWLPESLWPHRAGNELTSLLFHSRGGAWSCMLTTLLTLL